MLLLPEQRGGTPPYRDGCCNRKVWKEFSISSPGATSLGRFNEMYLLRLLMSLAHKRWPKLLHPQLAQRAIVLHDALLLDYSTELIHFRLTIPCLPSFHTNQSARISGPVIPSPPEMSLLAYWEPNQIVESTSCSHTECAYIRHKGDGRVAFRCQFLQTIQSTPPQTPPMLLARIGTWIQLRE